MRVNRMGGTAFGVAAVGGVVAGLLATGTVGFGRAVADPVPTVGFSPNAALGSSAAQQTG